MNKRSILCLALLGASAALATASADAPRTRDFDFTYTAHVAELPAEAHRVDVWLPYPTSDANQEVTVTAVSAPFKHEVVKESKYGNSILHLSVTDPKVHEFDVEMKVHVRRQEYSHNAFASLKADAKGGRPASVAMWLKPDRLVPLDDSVRDLAREVTKDKQGDLAKARAIYDYVVNTMAYDKTGTGWGNGDIHWACDSKRGNCTDFHALFIGLNRAVGIPAKFAIGFPLPPEHGGGEIPGYHCWAEFYLDGYGWVPVDASEARKHPEKRDYFFGAHDENRVQFTLGRDIVLKPKQAGDPLNYFIYPYVEVDGQQYSKVSKAFHYKDQDAAPRAAAK
ncbi:MAG TPA: transglutaminase domain-containing protein [Thermoanaerobaculia bacterium]|nr:transglutaminase domain-containing protein [Thermoanaerobaculia bacterium]